MSIARIAITIVVAVGLTGCAAGKTTSSVSSPPIASDVLDPARGPVTAPDFSLPSSDGSTIKLADANGYWIVLTFFPATDLPECACQATPYTPFLESLRDMPALMLAVTDLDAEALEIRRAKYAMQAYLLSDTNHDVVNRYNVWDNTTDILGRKGRIQRTTFVINPEGKIVARWINPDAEKHASQVRAALARATD